MDILRIQGRLANAGRDPGPADGILGKRTYRALFEHFGATTAADDLASGAAKHFKPYEITTALRLGHWLSQWGHESSGFQKFEENLRYSAPRLCQVWPSRFPTIAAATPYARNPEALANKVYGHRMGNSQPGDGWRFRGRGPQLTGRENYVACAQRTGLDLANRPDLAADPKNFALIACDFWKANRCNALADDDNLVLLTRRINGGSVGLDHRRQLIERAKAILC